MSSAGGPRPGPVPIGDVAEPPFVRLPDPTTLFAIRATRLRDLAPGHVLSPYLGFVARIADAQHYVQEGVAAPALPPPEQLARARTYGMPALDRNGFAAGDAFFATLDRFLKLVAMIDMPEPARAALTRTAAADAHARAAMIHAVLTDSLPVEALADHVFVAAALQVHFARLAAQLAPDGPVPVGDGACPACGGPPVSSLVVGWPGASGTRFCACSLCGTLWNYVRIKCTLCGSTEGIAYEEVEGEGGHVKAETCSKCRCYVKIMHQHKDPHLDPVADDIATLGLDLLVRERGFRRGAVDPFLLGY